MDPNTNIEQIKQLNFIKKIKNEIEYLKNPGNNMNIFVNAADYEMAKRIEYLEALINNPDKIVNKLQVQKDTMFSNVDKYTFKKQWNKLTPYHKIIKLAEFLDEFTEDITMRGEILSELSKYAEEGRINNKKYIIYDPNQEKILLVPCLTVDNVKKTFTIKVI